MTGHLQAAVVIEPLLVVTLAAWTEHGQIQASAVSYLWVITLNNCRQWPLHGVGLACTCLAIGKDGGVVATQAVVNNWLASTCNKSSSMACQLVGAATHDVDFVTCRHGV